MAALSQDELKAIRAHPLRTGLEGFRTTFKSKYLKSKDVNLTQIVDVLTSQASDRGKKDILRDLILALETQPAARTIPSRVGDGPLFDDIVSLVILISSNTLKFENFTPLVKLVLTEAEDAEIWIAVFDLVVRTKPVSQLTTPPPSHPSLTSSSQQMPWSSNTSSFVDVSEHRKQVDDVLRKELLPTLRIDTPNFLPAVFGHTSGLDELAQTLFDRCQEADTRLYTKGRGWIEWPMSAKEILVLDWLRCLMERLVAWTNSVHPTTSRQIYKGPSTYLDGSPIKRKMDVGIRENHGNENDEVDEKTSPKSSWAQILVVGELKSNPIEDGQEHAWLDLASYAREVFRTQDRSSGSSSFDINQEGLQFVHVMLGFYLMDGQQLGIDPTIQQSDGQRFVEIFRDNQIERLILIEEIRKQAVIAGRATTCWRAYCNTDQSKEPLVVKDSWQYEERSEEGELIKDATDKGTSNIARYYHHETVRVGGKDDDTTENVRKGSMKTGRTNFKQTLFCEHEVSASAPDTSAGEAPSLSRKRSASTAQMPPPASVKRSCSSLESWNPASPIHNRVHRRVITRNLGRPLYAASSPAVLITGLIGAIKGTYLIMNIKGITDFIIGHASLLNNGIFHRDISTGNIMLTEQENDGFLIDMDLAIRMDKNRASGAPSKTGTKVFMAIGALLGEHHSAVHDYESFFWVLFWICIHYNGLDEKREVKRRIVSRFEDWNCLSTEALAIAKAGQISDRPFRIVDVHFTDFCKPLVNCLRELHKVIFPGGQPRSQEDHKLYPQIIAVLEKAREDLRKSETVS